MKISKLLSIIAAFILMNNCIFSQVNQEWVQNYNGLGNGEDKVFASVTDNAGNIYVSGTTVAGNNFFDYITMKYNAAGVLQWAQRYNGTGNSYDYARAVTVDNSGNVYVTGASIGSGNSNYDIITIKYNSNGIEQWIKRHNSLVNGSEYGNAITTDNNGNIYITGYGNGNSGNEINIITLKYNSAGDIKWYQLYHGSGNGADVGYDVKTDHLGNVIVCGKSNWSGEGTNFFIIKYDSLAAEIWNRRINSIDNNDDAAYRLVIDNMNNVYAAGTSNTNATADDYITAKYSPAGTLLWKNFYNGPGNATDNAISITLDSNYNTIVTGNSFGGISNYDFATIKYDASGTELWQARFNSTSDSNDYASSVKTDNAGNIYVTGTSFKQGNLNDITTVKYDASGTQNWATYYNGMGNGNDEGSFVMTDNLNNVIVTGGSIGTNSQLDITVIKYSQPIGINIISSEIPSEFRLFQNYPNPFNPVTNIKYMISRAGMVELTVYDITGSEVRKLVNQFQNSGTYTVDLNASDLPSGIYFYKLKTGKFEETKKSVLIK